MSDKPSVTTVLDYFCPPQLLNWFKSNSKAKCEKIAEVTAGIGQRVDTLIQEDILDGGYVPPEDDQAIANCLAGWEQVKRDMPGFVGSVKEMQVEIEDDDVVGHPDFICQEEDGWSITDLKCTSGIRFKNWLQTARYAEILMRSRIWDFPKFIRIIRLQRDSPIPQVVTITDKAFIQYCMNCFKNYLAVYRSDMIFKEYFRRAAENEVLGITEEFNLDGQLNEEIFDGTY